MGGEQEQGLHQPLLAEVLLEGEPGEWSCGRDESGVRTAYREQDGVLMVVQETEERLVVEIGELMRVVYRVVQSPCGDHYETVYDIDEIQQGKLQIDPRGHRIGLSWTEDQYSHTCVVHGRSYEHGRMQSSFWDRMKEGNQPGEGAFILNILSVPVTTEI